jgi:3-oxoadipate enol-lactonase
MKIAVGDLEIGYDRQGEGEPVLLIMGLGAARIGWIGQMGELPKHFDVTCFDNRGIGESQTSRENWTIKDMAADALGLADALGYERFHLAGVSMGGMISQEIVLAAPERVMSLSLISTTPAGPEAPPMKPALAMAFSESDPDARMRRVLELTFGEKWRTENAALIDMMLSMSGGDGQAMQVAPVPGLDSSPGFFGQLGAVMSWMGEGGAAERLSEVKVPTLILHGGDDNLLPVGNGELLAELIPEARKRIFPEAGHALNFEEAQEVNEELIAHVRQDAPKAPPLKSPRV